MSEENLSELVYKIDEDHRNPIECITGDLVIALNGLHINPILDTTERLVMLTVEEDKLPQAKSAMDDLGLEFVSERAA